MKRKTGKTLKERYGKDYFQKLGHKGGSAEYTGKKGFASVTPEQRREWGRIGGQKSKKGVQSAIKKDKDIIEA